MNFEIFVMNGFGIYVWSSFAFTFLVCLFLFLRTKKTLKKLEKDKEIGQDDSKKFQDNIESITTSQINSIDDILKSKEEDLKKI